MKSPYHFLAKTYHFCEEVIFGSALQNCRTAFLSEIPPNAHVLSVGEGDGRFAQALLAQHPEVHLQVIEPDSAMRAQAQAKLPNLTFVANSTTCDILVLNFILDLFTEEEAHRFLDQLPPAKTLIIGDFFPNKVNGPATRLTARLLTWTMYRFFRLTTGLKTKKIPPIEKILTTKGWRLHQESPQWSGYITAQLWMRRDKNN